MKDLFDDLHSDSSEFLIGNDEEKALFISSLVDTRNYLTHFDMGNKKHVIEDSNDKFNVLMMLKGILAFIILKDLGINEEIVVKRFSEEWGLSYRINKGKTYIKNKLNELSLK